MWLYCREGLEGAVDKTSAKPVTTFGVDAKVYGLNDGRVRPDQYDLDRDKRQNRLQTFLGLVASCVRCHCGLVRRARCPANVGRRRAGHRR